MTRAPRAAWVAWMAVSVIWGTTYLGIRIALETVPPALMGGIRWTTAGLLVAATLRARGTPLPGIREWPGLMLLSVLMIGLGNGLVIWAEQYVPSGLDGGRPGDVAVLDGGGGGVLRGGERGDARNGRRPPPRLSRHPAARLAGSARRRCSARRISRSASCRCRWRCAGWALDPPGRSGMPQATMSSARRRSRCCSAACSCSRSAPLSESGGRSLLYAHGGGALTYLTGVGSIGGFVAYIYALRHLPVSTVSLYAYINPVIAVILGAIVLGEPFGLRIVLASGHRARRARAWCGCRPDAARARYAAAADGGQCSGARSADSRTS